MKYGTRTKITTINLKGLKQAAKREEVERWMKKLGLILLTTYLPTGVGFVKGHQTS